MAERTRIAPAASETQVRGRREREAPKLRGIATLGGGTKDAQKRPRCFQSRSAACGPTSRTRDLELGSSTMNKPAKRVRGVNKSTLGRGELNQRQTRDAICGIISARSRSGRQRGREAEREGGDGRKRERAIAGPKCKAANLIRGG